MSLGFTAYESTRVRLDNINSVGHTVAVAGGGVLDDRALGAGVIGSG